jgi:hypothetical protein
VIRVAAACLLAACSTDDGGPRLDAVMPTAAARGAMAVLTGSRLCGGGDCSAVPARLTLGSEPPVIDVELVSYADTTATFIVPALAPTGDSQLVATVGGRSSNALPFQVLATP